MQGRNESLDSESLFLKLHFFKKNIRLLLILTPNPDPKFYFKRWRSIPNQQIKKESCLKIIFLSFCFQLWSTFLTSTFRLWRLLPWTGLATRPSMRIASSACLISSSRSWLKLLMTKRNEEESIFRNRSSFKLKKTRTEQESNYKMNWYACKSFWTEMLILCNKWL